MMIVHPQGDVILELDNDSGAAELLVSLFILSSISPVFAEMLAAEREGSLIKTKETATKLVIRLTSDDDAEALIVLCKVVHFCSDAAQLRPSIKCIEKLVFLASSTDASML
jgi:hypothetical protein